MDMYKHIVTPKLIHTVEELVIAEDILITMAIPIIMLLAVITEEKGRGEMADVKIMEHIHAQIGHKIVMLMQILTQIQIIQKPQHVLTLIQ